MQTHNAFQWKLNTKTPTLSGWGGLCSSGFYHAYTHPLLAAFLNPIHANIAEPLLFQGYGYGKSESDNGLKIGFTEIKITKQIELPQPTTVQRVAFGLLCAKTVCKDADFVAFADGYLIGNDRSEAAGAAWAARAATGEDFSLVTLAEQAMVIS